MSLLMAAGVDTAGYYAYGVTMQTAAHRVAGVPPRAVLALMPIHVLTAVELLLGAAAQATLFAAAWLALAAVFVHSQDGARDDLRLLLDLIADGLGKIRRVVLRFIA
jgi:hypothetical protein